MRERGGGEREGRRERVREGERGEREIHRREREIQNELNTFVRFDSCSSAGLF